MINMSNVKIASLTWFLLLTSCFSFLGNAEQATSALADTLPIMKESSNSVDNDKQLPDQPQIAYPSNANAFSTLELSNSKQEPDKKLPNTTNASVAHPPQSDASAVVPVIEEENGQEELAQIPEILVPFSFSDKPLLDLINFLAEKKGVNVILPTGAKAIKPDQTITFKPEQGDKLPLSQAWNMLKTFLEILGYSLTFRENHYVVVKNDNKVVVREVLPLYIVPPDQLPNIPDRIRYIYYFANLKIGEESTFKSLDAIFKEMLSSSESVIAEPKSNAIIITDRADMITSVMRIVGELDASGFKETVEVIPLVYASASDVKKILDDLRLASGADSKGPAFVRSDPKAESSTYFPSGTVIQADPRTNSLIIMGRESIVLRIHDFVQDYIDVAPESGNSILHVYDLQYLEAEEFAKTLSNIVTRQGIGGEQSKGGPASVTSGPERFFRDVVIQGEKSIKIVSEKPENLLNPTAEKARGLSGSVYSGGNRLVIAALHDDWVRIKALIEELDRPQPIVIIEVLIVDLTENDTTTLAGDSRNTINCDSPTGVNYIASMISPTGTVIPVTAETLASDLLQLSANNGGVDSTITPGSLLVSFNDPCTGIFGLLQILQTVVNARVINHPYIVTLNNKVGTITISTIRRLAGSPYTGAGSVPTTPIVDVNATVQVQVLPRISSLDRLSLEIGIDINEFTVPVANPNNQATGNRITRYVGTNANLNSGQILILGGLTELNNVDTIVKTPILGDIPILGYFFKGKTRIRTNTNLAVFIAPTIVEPKLRGGLNAYTVDKVRAGREDVSDDFLFENFRDPVTRFLFTRVNESEGIITEYLSRSRNAPDLEELRAKHPQVATPTPRLHGHRRVRPTASRPVLPVAESGPKAEQADQVKMILACEENPLSAVKQRKG